MCVEAASLTHYILVAAGICWSDLESLGPALAPLTTCLLGLGCLYLTTHFSPGYLSREATGLAASWVLLQPLTDPY